MSATQKFNIVKIILNKSIFDNNVIHIILTYYWNILDYKKKILLNWIDIKQLYWDALSTNPNAIDLLKENIDKVDWYYLSKNPNAIEILKNNKHKINWRYLSKNPNAMQLLKEKNIYEKLLTKDEYNNLSYCKKIDWFSLSCNFSIFENESIPII